MTVTVNSLCMVKECRELEDACMQSGVQAHRYNSQQYSIGGDGSSDHGQLLKRCEQKTSLIFEVEKSVGWSKLWDVTLDVLSMRDERSAASEYRMISHHGRGN